MLDLRLTEDQQRNVAAWHGFAEDVMRPAAAEHDRAESTPMDVLEEAAQRGIYSLDFWAAGREDPTGLHWLLATEELSGAAQASGCSSPCPASPLPGCRPPVRPSSSSSGRRSASDPQATSSSAPSP